MEMVEARLGALRSATDGLQLRPLSIEDAGDVEPDLVNDPGANRGRS